MRWTTDARVLCIVDAADPAAEAQVERLLWRDLGIAAAPAGPPAAAAAALRPDRLSYASAPDKTATPPEGRWTPAQLNFSGHLRDEFAAPWLAREYDLLINFLPGACEPVDHFSAGARAHLRVAMHDACLRGYDLVLRPAPGTGVAGFVAELGRYLRVLNPGHVR